MEFERYAQYVSETVLFINSISFKCRHRKVIFDITLLEFIAFDSFE